MDKRGQVTVFIVLGILILGIVLGMVYVSQYLTKGKLALEAEESKEAALLGGSVKGFVESCLESTAKDSLLLLGQQGGYYQLLNKPLDAFFFNLIPFIVDENGPTDMELVFSPYYFNRGVYNFPELEVIENDLAESIEEGFVECVNDFTVFREQGYEFILGEMMVEPEITASSVVINLNYPIEVIKNDAKSSLEIFSKNIKFDFKEKYDWVNELMEEQKKDPETMPLGFLTNLAHENGFTFELVDYAEPVVQFNLIFEEEVFEFPFIYSFMFWYDWGEKTTELAPVEVKQLPLVGKGAGVVLFDSPDIDPETGEWEEGIDLGEDWGGMDQQDFIEAIIDDPSLLGETAVLDRFNDNPTIKQKWFDEFSITCSGCNLKSYNEMTSTVVTQGIGSTEFNPNELSGATVTEIGEVITKEGAVLSNGKVEVELATGEIIIDGGRVDLKKAKAGTYVSKNGYIFIPTNVVYTENVGEIWVSLDGGKTTIEGREVVLGLSRDSGEIDKEVSFIGGIVLHDDYVQTGHLTFREKTSITFYGADLPGLTGEAEIKPAINFVVDKEVDYYNRYFMCTLAEGSCMARDTIEGSLKVVPKNDVKIEIEVFNVFDETARKNDIALIEDGSKVNLNYQDEVILQFSKEPVKVIGDVSDFDGKLNSYIQNSDGLICGQSISGGFMSQGCTTREEYNLMQTTREFKELHEALVETREMGAFYGSSWIGRQRFEYQLKKMVLDRVPKVIDCIGYGTQVIAETYIKQGDPEKAQEFLEIVKEHNNKGTFIFKELIESGEWEGGYYNLNFKYKENLERYINDAELLNDPRLAESLRRQQKQFQDALAREENPTYGIRDAAVPINEKFEGIKTNPEQLELLSEVPFGMVCVEQGYHCAVLSYGDIYEVHWNKNVKSTELFEITPVEEWKPSGVITVPKGAFERAKVAVEVKKMK